MKRDDGVNYDFDLANAQRQGREGFRERRENWRFRFTVDGKQGSVCACSELSI